MYQYVPNGANVSFQMFFPIQFSVKQKFISTHFFGWFWFGIKKIPNQNFGIIIGKFAILVHKIHVERTYVRMCPACAHKRWALTQTNNKLTQTNNKQKTFELRRINNF